MSRRPVNPREAAEAAFKSATSTPKERVRETLSLPGGREGVTLRIDSDVLEWFQAEGPGWQERINAALRLAAGK